MLTKCLNQGEVRIVDTDTVKAYICSAFDKEAVLEIFKLKQRDLSKNLPVFVASIDQLSEICEFTERDIRYFNEYWPGQVTFILPVAPSVIIPQSCHSRLDRESLTGEFYLGEGSTNTVAVRIPDNKSLLQLCNENGPLAQTSYNISGEQPAGVSSTIVDLTTENPTMIRKGQVLFVKL